MEADEEDFKGKDNLMYFCCKKWTCCGELLENSDAEPEGSLNKSDQKNRFIVGI